MTPSVICLALFSFVIALLSLALILTVRNNRRTVLRLNRRHWNGFMTERRLNYDRGWSNGYEFHKSLDEVILKVALDYVSEEDLNMSGKQDRLSVLVGRMIEKIETRYQLFHEATTRVTNDPLLSKVAFYTTMIQIIKDNTSESNEAAQVERLVLKHLIRLRNEATKEIAQKYETVGSSSQELQGV